MKRKIYGINDSFETETIRLAEHIRSHTPYDGDFDNKTLNCKFGKYSKGGTVCVKTFNKSSLLIVAQGTKRVTIGREVYHVGKAQMLLLPVALPVEIHSLQANQSKPFLNIGLAFDSHRILELASKMYPQGIHKGHMSGTGLVADADVNIINAVNRLLMCLSNPDDIQYIAPIILDEILIRVLRSPIGIRIVQMGFTDSNMQGVIRAISWLGENFSRQVKIADLAKMAYMSDSTFHKHFKNVTSMTPLQYQKSLRLHEARRLMLSDSMDAAAASSLTGYVSISQFNRDYSRFFGTPPKRDMTKLRKQFRQHD
ncbi:MAG: AraC family transcriptional regulator [Spirochaetaceae bacterium]|jgi:AraC-like DNA-binding protein|nr:AraC family transcriptional regulator [Spirochaetaceae bacterium]